MGATTAFYRVTLFCSQDYKAALDLDLDLDFERLC